MCNQMLPVSSNAFAVTYIMWDWKQDSRLQDNSKSFLAMQRAFTTSRVSRLPVNIIWGPGNPALMADQWAANSWLQLLLWFINKWERIMDVGDRQSRGHSYVCHLSAVWSWANFLISLFSSFLIWIKRIIVTTEVGYWVTLSENLTWFLVGSRFHSLHHLIAIYRPRKQRVSLTLSLFWQYSYIGGTEHTLTDAINKVLYPCKVSSMNKLHDNWQRENTANYFYSKLLLKDNSNIHFA